MEYRSIEECLQAEKDQFANVQIINSRFFIADCLLIGGQYGLRTMFEISNGRLYSCGFFDDRFGMRKALQNRIKWLGWRLRGTPRITRTLRYYNCPRAYSGYSYRNVSVNNRPYRKSLAKEIQACFLALQTI